MLSTLAISRRMFSSISKVNISKVYRIRSVPSEFSPEAQEEMAELSRFWADGRAKDTSRYGSKYPLLVSNRKYFSTGLPPSNNIKVVSLNLPDF